MTAVLKKEEIGIVRNGERKASGKDKGAICRRNCLFKCDRL